MNYSRSKRVDWGRQKEWERVTGTEHRPKIQKARECGGLVEREKGNSLERKREGGKWDGGSFKDTHKKLPSLMGRWWLQSETESESEDCSSKMTPSYCHKPPHNTAEFHQHHKHSDNSLPNSLWNQAMQFTTMDIFNSQHTKKMQVNLFLIHLF